MPYIYNSSAASVNVSANLNPITAPPVGRYTHPWGFDVSGVSLTNNTSRHLPNPFIQFVPIKMDSTITINKIGAVFTGDNGAVDTWSYNIGLYTHDAVNNYPASLITTYGTLSYDAGVTTPGAQEITISQELLANTIYWIAVGVTVSGTTDVPAGKTPALFTMQGDFQMYRKRGMASVSSGSLGACWAHSIGTYAGTLPATVTYAANSTSLPTFIRIAFRRSA